MRLKQHRQRGVALIMVLLVVALATAAAVSMVSANHLDMQRTGNRLAMLQAQQLGAGAELWAAVLLRERREQTPDGGIDARHQRWAAPLPPLAVQGGAGTIRGELLDLQGQFNVNNLADAQTDRINPQALALLRQLMLVLELDPVIAEDVAEWVTTTSAAAASYYHARQPPHAAAAQPAMDVAELRLVRGMDTATWNRLRPHLTALPEPTRINLNTTNPELLRALVPGLSAREAQILHEHLHDAPLTDIADVHNLPGVQAYLRANRTDLAELATVRSSWFLARGHIDLGPGSQRMNVWIYDNRERNETRFIRRSTTRSGT